MKYGRLAQTVFGVFWVFLILSFSQVQGEDLFRWTDDTGRPCYSNVSPPAGVKEYSADTVFHRASDRLGLAPASDDTNTRVKMPVEMVGSTSSFSAAFLKQRIMDRKRSIDRIEALLRKHPNDPVLRKSLFKKKRYLSEDLTRLENAR